MDTDWKTLESDVAELLANCDNEADRQMILERLSPIKTKLEQVQNIVEHKAAVHQKWVEHSDVCAATKDKIQRLQDSLANKNLTVEEISELRVELDEARDQLRELESHQPEMAAMMADAEVVFKDRSTQKVVDIGADVQKMLNDVEKDDAKMKVCARIAELDVRLRAADSGLDSLKHVYVDEIDDMGNRVQVFYKHAFFAECAFVIRAFD